MSSSEPVRLAGAATVAAIPAQRERLVAALAAANGPVTLDLSQVKQADVTLVQLVLSTRSAAASGDRDVSVAAWSPSAAEAFVRAGLALESFAPHSFVGD